MSAGYPIADALSTLVAGLTQQDGVDRTADEEIEYQKCLADAAYFIDTYCKIKSDTGHGLIRFRLFDYQRAILADFATYLEMIILKARQLGITELLAAYSVWFSLRPHNDIVIFSQGKVEADDFVRKATTAWENLPPWLKLPLKNATKKSTLEFVNGSRIIPKPATANAGRGLNAQLLIIDEWAHQEFADAVYAAAAPAALSAGNQIIGLSTANGAGNLFHRQWKQAVEGFGAHPVFLPWHARPGRDQRWYDRTVANKEEWLRHQEFPANADEAFILSGRPRFDQAALTTIEARCEEPLETVELGTGPTGRAAGFLRVWAHPVEGRKYVCGADTAEGLEKGDYSAAVLYDWVDGTDVAELHGHWAPDEYAHHLAALCTRYNTALIGVERNNHGHAVLLALQQIENYQHLYRHAEYDQIARKVLARPPGWQTTSKSKPIMIDGLAVAIREMGTMDGDLPLRPSFRNKFLVTEARTYAVDASGGTGASGCFVGGTPILMGNGSLKPIDVVHCNDTVITHVGREQTVYDVMERTHTGEIVDVHVNGTLFTISATPDHPFWARRRTSTHLQRYAVRPEFPAEWVAAQSLRVGDWLSVPKRTNLVPSELTEDQLYALGFWLAEGSIREASSPGGEPRGISLSNTERGYIDRAGATLAAWFPADAKKRGNQFVGWGDVEYPSRVRLSTHVSTTGRDKERFDWRLYSRSAGEYFLPFKSGGHGMKVIPDAIYNRSGLLAVVSGFIDGDGTQRSGQQQDVCFYTVCPTLAWQLRQICIDSGVWCTIRVSQRKSFQSRIIPKTTNPPPLWSITIKASFLHKLPPCKVRVPECRFVRRVIEDDSAFYAPISKIERRDYTGPVYDLTVGGDSSFVAGGVAAHNSLHDDRIIAYAIAEQLRKVAGVSGVPHVSPGGDTKAPQFSGTSRTEDDRSFSRELLGDRSRLA